MPADTSAFFQRVQNVKQLQVAASEQTWIEQHAPPQEGVEFLLYLGCNILRTPHVAQTVIDVFEHLELDFAAVGGAAYCCGVVWDRAGDVDGGRKVSTRTVGRFEDYGASTVVMWCPSCNVHFTDAVFGRDQIPAAFETTHTPDFLNDLSAQGRLEWRHEVPLRVALHAHVGADDHLTGQQRADDDRTSVTRLLETIPGIEIVDTIAAPQEFGFDCGPVATSWGADRFADARQPDVDRVRELGVDAVVTISHACQREWCDVATDGLDVVNYISLVARSLGMPERDDTLKRLKSGRLSPEQVVAVGRDAWASHGIDERRALELAATYFGPGLQP